MVKHGSASVWIISSTWSTSLLSLFFSPCQPNDVHWKVWNTFILLPKRANSRWITKTEFTLRVTREIYFSPTYQTNTGSSTASCILNPRVLAMKHRYRQLLVPLYIFSHLRVHRFSLSVLKGSSDPTPFAFFLFSYPQHRCLDDNGLSWTYACD